MIKHVTKSKFFIFLIFCLLMVIPIKTNASTITSAIRIDRLFSDTSFQQLISNRTGRRTNQTVTQAQLDNIRITLNDVYADDTLNISEFGVVQNLEGIQYLNNVESFSINGNGLTSATISQLGNINSGSTVKRVQFYGNNNITDLSFFANPQFNHLWEILFSF